MSFIPVDKFVFTYFLNVIGKMFFYSPVYQPCERLSSAAGYVVS